MNIAVNLAVNVLFSVRPHFASKIVAGEKTVELRRRFPEEMVTGGRAVIYASKPVGAIVCHAKISHVVKLPLAKLWKLHGQAACISKKQFAAYFDGATAGFAISLGDVTPVTGSLNAAELFRDFGIVPPQSFRYLGEEMGALFADERIQAPHRHEHSDRPRGRSTSSSKPGRTGPALR